MPGRLRIAKLEALGGTLGLTLCPGRTIRGLTGMPPRDLDADLAVIVEEGFDRAGVLLEDHELDRFAPRLLEAYAERGIQVHRHPIVDADIPSDTVAFRAFVNELAGHLRQGERVLVHCRGGLGRAGLVSACLLTLDGRLPGQAIAEVRAARPGAVETVGQERFVAEFAEPSAS